MLGHELRNPLAPIRNAAQVLRLLGLADPRLQWARDVIDRQVGHMTRLVDDLLDVSRISRGKITLKTEPIELAAVIERAVEVSRPLLEARRHELTVDAARRNRCGWKLTRPAGPGRGQLAEQRRQVHRPAGGQVRLTVERQGETLVLRVRTTAWALPRRCCRASSICLPRRTTPWTDPRAAWASA